MITINDNDLPITVAEKLITGTKPNNLTPLMKAFCYSAADTVDMFDIEEIKEIADYLIAYYENNKRKEAFR